MLSKPGIDKPVDRMLTGCRRRKLWQHRLDEGPVRPVLSPGGNPVDQNLLFGSGQRNLGMRRRHHQIGIIASDAGHQFTGGNVSRRNRCHAAVELGDSRIAAIQP